MQPIGKLNAAIYRNLQSLINFRLGDIPILSGQCDFFFVISRREGLSQKELSAHMFVNKSTTAKAVQNLVEKDLVAKKKDPYDKRLDRLYLTTRGRLIAPRIEKLFAHNMAVCIRDLNESETEQLAVILHKVLNNLLDEKHKVLGEKHDA